MGKVGGRGGKWEQEGGVKGEEPGRVGKRRGEKVAGEGEGNRRVGRLTLLRMRLGERV